MEVFMENKKLESALDKWQKLQPLSEIDKGRLSRRFTVDFNYNSNHIEGNTLTYGQTELLLLFDKVIGTADFREYEEMKASDLGLKMMLNEAAEAHQPLTQNFIRALHKTLIREDYDVTRTLPDGMQIGYTVHAGQYKTRPNSVITRYGERFDYASPEETPAFMADLVDWYNKAEQEGLFSPVDLAVLFHYRFIRIHPFEDGNGRIARLMVNYILSCPAIATRANSAVIISFFFIVLFYLYAKDVVVRYIFQDVRRKVGFDFIVTAKTASAIFGFVPIRAIEDERDKLPLLEWRNKFEGTRFVHVPLVGRMIGITYRH